MLTKEEFEKLITSIKEKLDETVQALVSEDLLGVMSSYNNAIDEVSSLGEKITKLEADKEDLLKVNGRLFQKIGFDKEEETTTEGGENVGDTEKLEIEDVIDEKGELI